MNKIISNKNREVSEEDKEQLISKATKSFGRVLTELGYDWENDPNMNDTPHRFIKSMVRELCSGNYNKEPKITAFENTDKYDGIVAQCNIEMYSLCAHHLLAFSGVAHVAYIPSEEGKIIGLSKLNRIVDFFARRPQVQENLTMQVHDFINTKCEKNKGVIVMIQANHTCCSNRGVGHNSTMLTCKASGIFLDNKDGCKDEFLKMIEFTK